MSEVKKPCPFCGSTKIKAVHDDGQHWDQCQQCYATGPACGKYSGEEDQAFTGWHSRSAEDTLAAENKRLRAANLDCVAHFNQMRDELAALKGEQVAVLLTPEVREFLQDAIDDTYDGDAFSKTDQAFIDCLEVLLGSIYTHPAPQQPGQDVALVAEHAATVVRDLFYAEHVKPSCQDGNVDMCKCWSCAAQRADEAVAHFDALSANDKQSEE